jgi:Zn finger protein HypA/HybF involved in hydrogenase expression
VCSGNKVQAGFNDLATTNPELAEQADGWDPTTLSAGSSRKVGWKCELGHSWNAQVANRSLWGGCPVCSGRKVQAGFNDLATTNPRLAAQADGWDPTTVTAGSNIRVKWKCEFGHKSVVPVSQRSQYGCPVCSGHKVLAGFNDLATTNPRLAAQADGWDPTTLSAGSSRKVGWKCELGHGWNATVASRAAGRGCAFCSGRAVLAGFNDLATINPKLAALADGWDPTTLTAYSNEKVGWKCELGHKSVTTVGSRSAGFGCPVCVNQEILVGYNDLATTNPELAAQADGWDPTTVTAGNGKKKRWKCEFGHIWITSPNARTLFIVSTSGCPSCTKFGFDPNKNGWLYFIDHDELQMFKIGISNVPEDRLSQHSKRGWEVIELRGPMDGHLTQQLEIDCLHALEKRGAILGHKAGIEKFDGYTEAWTKKSLNVTSIKQILDWVYEDEAK